MGKITVRLSKFLLGAAALCALVSYFGFHRVRAQGQGISRVPFTLIYVLRAESTRSNAKMEERMYEAHQSDGSKAEGPVDPNSARSRALAVASRRMVMRVSDGLRMKSTEYVEPAPGGETAPKVRPDKCATGKSGMDYVGQETILGLSTFHHVLKFVDALTISQDVWMYRELGCVVVQMRMASRDKSGAVTSISERIPISLTIGEPDPALFEVDAGYTEVKPSEFMVGLARADLFRRGDATAAANPPVPEQAQREWAKMDQKYQESQKFKPLN